MKYLLTILGISVVLVAVWWSPPVQQWKERRVEVEIQKHWDSAHDHYYDEQMWEYDTEPVPDTVWLDGMMIEMDSFPGPPEWTGHEHFGLNDSSGVVAILADEHLWTKILNNVNAIAMMILALGNAVAVVYWKIRKGPKE